MKYRVIKDEKAKTLDIFTEDGGFVEIYHNDAHYISNMHSVRLTEINKIDYPILWIKIAEGNNYIRDWSDADTEEDMIEHALYWLVSPAPERWQKDDTLFENILKIAYKN